MSTKHQISKWQSTGWWPCSHWTMTSGHQVQCHQCWLMCICCSFGSGPPGQQLGPGGWCQPLVAIPQHGQRKMLPLLHPPWKRSFPLCCRPILSWLQWIYKENQKVVVVAITKFLATQCWEKLVRRKIHVPDWIHNKAGKHCFLWTWNEIPQHTYQLVWGKYKLWNTHR